MKRIIFEDAYNFADRVHDDYTLNDYDDVLVVAKYDKAKEVLRELVHYGHDIEFAEFYDSDWNGYDKEFYLYLSDEGISISPAFGFKKDGYSKDTYLIIGADKTYIHEDCNSAIIKYIDCDDIVEFGYQDNEIDNNSGDTTENDCIVDTVSTIIYKTDDGVIHGFSRSWNNTDENANFYHPSVTYFNDNIDELKEIMDLFGIQI
ncbi:hypothetical protein H8S37_04565 [Mediterraneibacter sp. NSJ-55]|uniref:Uncharacterized protein n=1 Tax=Mediterraneibacter hominis TaxID=2763054 RepID=A0A923RRA7_9FIRM|nr:hypothetical protein [Mediterraneibacter hominis]MBC5688202.1 hypothetical protein [Mediterraneibacter hominis]